MIAGFPKTDVNYQHSVTLLFKGKVWVTIHISECPYASLARAFKYSQHTFKSAIISQHSREGLSSFGKFPESYADLLTSIIFGRLPREVQKNLARDHNSVAWTINELRSGIMKEI